MAKITIADILENPGTFVVAINSAFQQIEDELNNKVLYRDNPPGEDNTMQNDLDMNSNDLLNGGTGHFKKVIVDGITIVPGAGGGDTFSVIETSTNLAVDTSTDVVMCTGAVTLTLPSGAASYKSLAINADGGTVTLAPDGTDTLQDTNITDGNALVICFKPSTSEWRTL